MQAVTVNRPGNPRRAFLPMGREIFQTSHYLQVQGSWAAPTFAKRINRKVMARAA